MTRSQRRRWSAARAKNSNASATALSCAAGSSSVSTRLRSRPRIAGGGDVDRGHARGAAEQRVEREPAGVGEHVEHRRAGGVAADRAPVLALVEEEPGLLAGADVDGEPRLVLGDHDLGRRVAAGRLAAPAVAPGAADPDVGELGAAALEAVDHRAEVAAPERRGGGAVEDDHGGVRVEVDDEARAGVALAVDEAAAGAADEQRVAGAAPCGGLDAGAHPAGVDRRAGGVEDARADRGVRVGERERDRAVAVDDRDEITGGEAARRLERAVVDPGVARADPRAQRLGQAPAHTAPGIN